MSRGRVLISGRHPFHAEYGGGTSLSLSLSVSSPSWFSPVVFASGPRLFHFSNNFDILCFRVNFTFSTGGKSIGPEVSSSSEYPCSCQRPRVSPSPPSFPRTHHFHSSLQVNSLWALNTRRPPQSRSTLRRCGQLDWRTRMVSRRSFPCTNAPLAMR